MKRPKEEHVKSEGPKYKIRQVWSRRKNRTEALNLEHTEAGLKPWQQGQGSEGVCICNKVKKRACSFH